MKVMEYSWLPIPEYSPTWDGLCEMLDESDGVQLVTHT